MTRISLALGTIAIATVALTFPSGCANDTAGRDDSYNNDLNYSNNGSPERARGNNVGTNTNDGTSNTPDGGATDYGNMGHGAGGGGSGQ